MASVPTLFSKSMHFRDWSVASVPPFVPPFHDELMQIAKKRLAKFEAVVANRGDEVGAEGEQIAWLLTRDNEPSKIVGKVNIAHAIADHLESATALMGEGSGGGSA